MAITNRIPYTPVTLVVLRLEEVMTCESIATIDTIYTIQISATRTVRRAATAMETALLDHFWLDHIILIRMKLKRFTTQLLHHKVGWRIALLYIICSFPGTEKSK